MEEKSKQNSSSQKSNSEHGFGNLEENLKNMLMKSEDNGSWEDSEDSY